MRTHFVPWLSSTSPDLASQTNLTDNHSHPELTPEELEKMLQPKHMSESYTVFNLPLGSDAELLERYVNTTGGFRGFFSSCLRINHC